MKNIMLYISIVIEDDVIYIGGHGYSYTEKIEKNRNGANGFLNTDIGYIPTAHSVNYKYELVQIDEFIDLFVVSKEKRPIDMIKDIISYFKDYEVTILTEHNNLKTDLEENNIKHTILETYIFNIGVDISTKLTKISKNLYLKENKDIFEINMSPVSKYWKPTVVKHPFMNFKQVFTITNEHIPGKYAILQYSDDNELGRKTLSAGYGLAILKEPVSDVEEVIDYYTKYYKESNTLISINIRAFYTSSIYFYYSKYGSKALTYLDKDNRHITTVLGDIDNIIANNIYPVGLGFSAMDNIDFMNKLLTIYKGGKTGLHIDIVDISKELYDDTDKGRVFKKELTNNDSIFYTYEKEGIKPHKINLKLNIDLMERNNFKNIEKLDPKVSLLIINHKNIKIEYYSIIECRKSGDMFVWANYYTNILFLKNKKGSKNEKEDIGFNGRG